MAKYLKIFLLLTVCGFALGSLFLFWNKKEFENETPISIQGSITKKEISEADTDKDGLYDWEEELWNTDPKNADTDGDGVSDDEEVKNGRNPLVSGPDDILSQTSENGDAGSRDDFGNGEGETTLTPTEKLGRELFARYLTLKQNGMSLDEGNTEAFIDEIIKKAAPDISYRVYTAKDARTAKAQDDETIKKYGGDLGQVFINNRSRYENELIIFSRFSDSGNRKELEKLLPIISSYRSILKSELEIVVPRSALEKHLSFVNAISFVLKSLENMSAAENDPFTVLVTLERHIEAAEALKNSIDSLQAYFEEKKISYEEGEAGYAFTHGI